MNQRRPLGRRDDAGMMMGDNVFMGVNMKLDPSRLAPGYVSEAVNCRFRNGAAESRLGSTVMAWLNKVSGTDVQPWGVVYGAGEFKDPTTFLEYVLIAADGVVYICRENNAPRVLAMPSGETVTDRCTFIQAFDSLLLLRGFDLDPLVMTDVNEGFKAIVQTATGDGTLVIPRCLRGCFAANRVFLLREDDTLVASDVLDYTRYTLFNDFRVNQGDADRGVHVVPWGQSSLVVFKERSVYRVDNVYGNLESITFSLVTRRYGCIAADSVADAGSDLLWLSQEGVASLTLTIQNEIQAGQGAYRNRMFSEEVGPLIDRVNGRYSSGAFGLLWDDKYYLGLPVDQAEKLGNEILLNQVQFNNVVPPYALSVANRLSIGSTYRFTVIGGNTTEIGDGTTTLTASGEFTAAATTLVAESTVGAQTCSDSLRRVFKGVNTVLAHYDFQNSAWGGYDESESVTFQYLFTASYVGRRRLFVVDAAGYVRLWEEGYADRLAEPYSEVTVAAVPALGDTIQVNGGTTVTAIAGGVNTATGWGISGSLATTRTQFYKLTPNALNYSYNQSDTSPWSAPDAIAYVVTTAAAGVFRFYSTNGVLPEVTTTGTWAEVTYYTEQAVAFALTTRAYTDPGGERCKFISADMDVQTWSPSITASLLADGVNETESLKLDGDATTLTRSRVQYTRLGLADWVPDNSNDDHGNPYREDYSILQTGADWEMSLHDGVRTDLHQESRITIASNLEGRSARISLANGDGRLRLMQSRLNKTELSTPAGVST